jgi:chemotaxis protein methyltransferase CheR
VGGISPASIPEPSHADKPFAPLLRNPTYDIRIIEPPEDEVSRTKAEVNPSPPQAPSSKAQPGAAEWVDLCQQAEALMKQHRYDEARQRFLSCLTREPDSVTALCWMACLEANVGRLEEARTWAKKALDHDPLLSAIHYTLALIHEVQGELQEAVNRLKKVIYLDPNFILAHFGLFHLCQRIGNPTEAERHRTLAIHLASKLSPDTVLPGSDDLTAGQLLAMARVPRTQPVVMSRGGS